MKIFRSLMTMVVAAAVLLLWAAPSTARLYGIGRDAVTGVLPGGGSQLNFKFTARAGRINTPDGASLLFWGFADGNAGTPVQYPGPTLILNVGDTVAIELSNELNEPVSLVFPGLVSRATVGGGAAKTAPVFSGSRRERVSSLAPEVPPFGAPVTYSFTADRPGTFYFQSGSNPEVQLRLGLFGAIVVKPPAKAAFANISSAYNCPPLGHKEGTGGVNTITTSNQGVACVKTFNQHAYQTAAGDVSTAYDREYLFLVSEMDPRFSPWVEEESKAGRFPIDYSRFHKTLRNQKLKEWKANYWFMNGRNAPDTMSALNVSNLPNQPYNIVPLAHPGERILARFINMGLDLHPFHTHGNHMKVIAEDAQLASTDGNRADLSLKEYTLKLVPGKTFDALFEWTGEKLGWDVYGHAPAAAPEPYEWLADHGKVFPTAIPNNRNTFNGFWWSGSPFMGNTGVLPVGDGGFNPLSGYYYMWHSHAERELTNNNIFPGGFLTMTGIVPWAYDNAGNDTIQQYE